MPFENFTNLSEFEVDARWWLPSSPERIVSGRLVHQKSGQIRIDLMGTLDATELAPGPLSFSDFFHDFDVVLGATIDGRPCTILGARETSAPAFRGDIGKCRLQARRLYFGAHFNTKDEVQFREQHIQLTHLEAWVGITPMAFNWIVDPPELDIRIPRKPAEILKVRIEHLKTDIKIVIGSNWSQSEGKFECERRGEIQIAPDEPRTHEWFEKVVKSLTNFMTLAIGRPVFPRRITATPLEETESPRSARPFVEVFIRLHDAEEGEAVSWADMPVPYHILSDKAATVFTSWFAREEILKPVLGLLLTIYYNADMYLEAEFLTLIQVLEIFHRRVVGGSYLTLNEWEPHKKTLADAIPNTLSKAHREALKSRLHYGNEYSLRKRLADMLEGIDQTARNRLTEGYENFAAECAKTRNLLVHEGEGGLLSKGLAELWKTNQRLLALIQILVWKELGLPEQTISTEIFERILRV